MAALSADERTLLAQSLRRLLADHAPERAVRKTMETAAGYDAELWRQLAELGVVGLVIEERFGGAGAGPLELEVMMEEAGGALLCSPLLASGVVAAQWLQALGDEATNASLLPSIANGSLIATAALTGERGCWTEAGVEVEAERYGEAWRLNGVSSYVLHGQNADVLLVLAQTADGLGAFQVDPAAAGVAVAALPTFDHTLRLARIVFEGAKARRLNASGSVWAAVRQAQDLALVALAGEQAGAGRRCLDFTVDYAKTRIQFGRAIGSFQAIKHMAADLLLESEDSISAARHAAARLAEGASDANVAVSLAAFACADAFTKIAADSIQMHGGIGFTWDHPAHLYLRRARSDAQLFGDPAFHRERYIQALGG